MSIFYGLKFEMSASGTDDVNAVVGGYLRDLAYRAGVAAEDVRLQAGGGGDTGAGRAADDLLGRRRHLPRIPGIGPGSDARHPGGARDRSVADGGAGRRQSDRRADIARRRQLRQHVLSRAEVAAHPRGPVLGGPSRADYRGDLQMHSEWSDGTPRRRHAEACLARGYQYAAVTDHSHGLRIAGGMSMAEAARQRRAIDALNASTGPRFQAPAGHRSEHRCRWGARFSRGEAATFEMVLAAPHSRLRARGPDRPQLAAIEHPAVRILAHPRGRNIGTRAGIVADWDAVFAAAPQRGVAIEIDGDPARQDLDYTLARARSPPAASSRSTATRTPPRSCATRTPPSRTRGSPASRRIASSTAGRWSDCWPGSRAVERGPAGPCSRWTLPRARARCTDSRHRRANVSPLGGSAFRMCRHSPMSADRQ